MVKLRPRPPAEDFANELVANLRSRELFPGKAVQWGAPGRAGGSVGVSGLARGSGEGGWLDFEASAVPGPSLVYFLVLLDPQTAFSAVGMLVLQVKGEEIREGKCARHLPKSCPEKLALPLHLGFLITILGAVGADTGVPNSESARTDPRAGAGPGFTGEPRSYQLGNERQDVRKRL